jgi:NAD(P)-dependent dehydrogenase (short-subunit alcohol dehydrogenase family)
MAKRTAFVEAENLFGVRRLLFGLTTPNGPHKANKAFWGKSSQESQILIDSNRNARLTDVEMEDRMKGKTCVITGATSGIGKAAAFALAAKGACLVIIGRNTPRGERISRELRVKYPFAQSEYRRADLSSLDDVRELAAAISAKHRRIDVLINNAGARYDRYHESPDGFELTFATNHLGHFLLTCLLWDCLLASGSARIITVSSSAHASARTDGIWLAPIHGYDRRQAYAKSKLANILFAFELARRLASTGATSNALHPGAVATGFARNNGLLSWLRHIIVCGINGTLLSAEKGAETIVYLAADDAVARMSGRYFVKRQPVDPAPAALETRTAAALWNSSLQWTKLDESIGATWKYIKPAAF